MADWRKVVFMMKVHLGSPEEGISWSVGLQESLDMTPGTTTRR